MNVFLCFDDDIGFHECANCSDASWFYRDEQPIVNDKGIKFCSVECADEAETRWEREAAWRASDWCPECGFDNHEHQDFCSRTRAGRSRHTPKDTQ